MTMPRVIDSDLYKHMASAKHCFITPASLGIEDPRPDGSIKQWTHEVVTWGKFEC